MAGIYLHIPFCKQACHYCNFHFSTSLKYKNDFVSALLKEIKLQQEYLQHELIETIYFGGGTPSLLTFDDINRIISTLHQTFTIKEDVEITLEANPDDINTGKVKQWKLSEINRFSIGIQSFFDEDLQWMNRAHNSTEAINSIHAIADEGIENITIDLIYGTPTLSEANWKRNIDRATELNIPHLSCYALTVEPKTTLAKMIKEKRTEAIDQSDQARQFLLLMDWLRTAGYEHYEISNFAKSGFRSKHNSSYWQGKKYLGLGPSAHSFNGNSRQWNVANNMQYIQSLQKNELNFEKEALSPIQKLNEYIMTSLRTVEGCDLHYVKEEFGENRSRILQGSANDWSKKSLLIIQDSKMILTDEGKLFADGIAADLFFEDPKDQ